MSEYRTLFGIRVEHEYFAPARCDALDFRIDDPSAALLRRAGVVFRREPDGVHAYHDRESESVLGPWLADPGERFRVVLRVVARDPAFFRYTELPDAHPTLVRCLDSEIDGPPGSLFRLDPPSDPGARARDEALAAEVVTRRDELVPPVAILGVLLGPSALAGGDAPPYRLAFTARRTVWRYHLLGDLASRDAFIRDQSPDPADQVRFEAVGMVSLPEGRTARMLVSDSALPTRWRAERRLQLREEGSRGERVLVRRLPVASPEDLSVATIDGRQIVVSDIYVTG